MSRQERDEPKHDDADQTGIVERCGADRAGGRATTHLSSVRRRDGREHRSGDDHDQECKEFFGSVAEVARAMAPGRASAVVSRRGGSKSTGGGVGDEPDRGAEHDGEASRGSSRDLPTGPGQTTAREIRAPPAAPPTAGGEGHPFRGEEQEAKTPMRMAKRWARRSGVLSLASPSPVEVHRLQGRPC